MFQEHQPDRGLSSVSTRRPVAISPQLAALIASKPQPELPLLPTIRARPRSQFDHPLRVPRYFGGPRLPYQRSPDRVKALKRRRQLAWRTNAMPDYMRMQLTEAEMAYANLVREQHERQGYFDLCHDAAAALMGVCAKTVQRAQHQLRLLGWIKVDTRPRPGRQKHLPNIVTIISPEWLAWIARGTRRPAPIESGHSCPATQSDKKTETSFANAMPIAAKETMTTPPASAYCGVTKGTTEVESAKVALTV